ncbi:MAG: hypothetical protein ACK4Y4_09360, partial [Brevundimonas sp.]
NPPGFGREGRFSKMSTAIGQDFKRPARLSPGGAFFIARIPKQVKRTPEPGGPPEIVRTRLKSFRSRRIHAVR